MNEIEFIYDLLSYEEKDFISFNKEKDFTRKDFVKRIIIISNSRVMIFRNKSDEEYKISDRIFYPLKCELNLLKNYIRDKKIENILK